MKKPQVVVRKNVDKEQFATDRSMRFFRYSSDTQVDLMQRVWREVREECDKRASLASVKVVITIKMR